MSNRSCCVVGCTSSKLVNPDILLYSFPHKTYESERKEKWINAIKREGFGGKPWRPTKNSVVCSKHFVSGKKSPDENNIDYIPSVFPLVYYFESIEQQLKMKPQITKIVNGNDTNDVLVVTRPRTKPGKPPIKGSAVEKFCCVPGCSTTQATPRTQLFSFSTQVIGSKVIELWLRELRNNKNMGSNWTPSDDSNICSKHFTFDKETRKYLPKIFPEIVPQVMAKPREAEKSLISNENGTTKTKWHASPSMQHQTAVADDTFSSLTFLKTKCCVEKCNFRNPASFYSFPQPGSAQVKWWHVDGKQEVIDLRVAWIIAINLDIRNITSKSFVCSRHFSRQNFIDPESGRSATLKPHAVPDTLLPDYTSIRELKAKAASIIKYFKDHVPSKGDAYKGQGKALVLMDVSSQTTCNSLQCRKVLKIERSKSQNESNSNQGAITINRKAWLKPLLTMKQLITLAIINGPARGLVDKEIILFLSMHFPFFSTQDKDFHELINNTLKIHPDVFVADGSAVRVWTIKPTVVDVVKRKTARTLAEFLPSSKTSMRFSEKAGAMFKGELMWEGSLEFLVQNVDLNNGSLDKLKEVLIRQGTELDKKVKVTTTDSNIQPMEAQNEVPSLSSKENESDYPAPPLSQKELCCLAIINTPKKEQRTVGIYAFVREMFPFYKPKKSWQGSIRHILSHNDMFSPSTEAGKGNGNLWRIACPDKLKAFREKTSMFYTDSNFRQSLLSSMSCPEKADAMLQGTLLGTWFNSNGNQKTKSSIDQEPTAKSADNDENQINEEVSAVEETTSTEILEEIETEPTIDDPAEGVASNENIETLEETDTVEPNISGDPVVEDIAPVDADCTTTELPLEETNVSQDFYNLETQVDASQLSNLENPEETSASQDFYNLNTQVDASQLSNIENPGETNSSQDFYHLDTQVDASQLSNIENPDDQNYNLVSAEGNVEVSHVMVDTNVVSTDTDEAEYLEDEYSPELETESDPTIDSVASETDLQPVLAQEDQTQAPDLLPERLLQLLHAEEAETEESSPAYSPLKSESLKRPGKCVRFQADGNMIKRIKY